MKRRTFLGMLAGGLLAAPLAAEAQPQARVARIGVIPSGSPATSAASVDTFRQRLRELGYVEGRNIAIEVRYAVAQTERSRGAAELVGLGVDVIVASGTLATRVRINPTGEAPGPMSLDAVQTWLREHHRFGEIPKDQLDLLRGTRPDFNNIHAGHFLIDRAGVVRWVHIETSIDDLSRYSVFPTDDEILAAARAAGV